MYFPDFPDAPCMSTPLLQFVLQYKSKTEKHSN